MKSAIILIALFTMGVAEAGTFHDVTLPDEVTVDGKKKILNGMALRKVKKLGIPFKVYVGGLYLDEKSQDSEAILNSAGSKHIIMHYKRSVGRGQIVDGWEKCKKACVVDCKNWHAGFKKFKPLINKSKKNRQFKLTFYADKMHVDNGEEKGTVEGAEITKNILSCFISEKHPPSQRFRREILGLAKAKK